MRSLVVHDHLLDAGLASVRTRYGLPQGFPEPVEAAAADAATRRPSAHRDRTDQPFVTLDPEGSVDLDQAFLIERGGSDLLLHYAIADVGWFVDEGGPLEAEAWRRGSTVYLPDGKVPLYPQVLSDRAASLLPDGPRPAVILRVRLDESGAVELIDAERAVIRSRAKLTYESVRATDLPPEFAEFARRVAAAEDARGAGNIEPPEQHVERDDGRYRLSFRPRRWSEMHNAALSLATNLAVADVLYRAGTGVFRVMDAPDERAIRRLRHTAVALGLQWPSEQSLEQFSRGLDSTDPAQAAFVMAVRRSGGGAEYRAWEQDVVPWHAVMAATYTHATAPLRRLVDRYVIDATLAVVSGGSPDAALRSALARLPGEMAQADRVSNAIEREVVDLAEAVLLHGSEGQEFDAVVVDENGDGARIQLTAMAVKARLRVDGLRPGARVRVRLERADPVDGQVVFSPVV